MPKYQITVPDGRQVMVDAANPQDAAEAADTWANQSKSAAQIKATADFQPIKPGAGGAMRSVVNGLTFNFAPEFDGGLAAGVTGLRNFVAHATGQPDAGYGMADAFDAERTMERNQGQQFTKDHPVQNIAGTIAGAVMNPVNAIAGKYVAGAGSIPAAMVRGGAAGAATGAAYGAGAGGPGQRGRGAVTGALTGGVLGAAAPPLLAAGGAALRAGKNAVSDTLTGARNLISPPDPEALAGAADTQAAMQRLTDLAQAGKAEIPMLADPTGKGMTTAEALGRPGVSTLGALARRSGTTPDLAEAALRARASGAPNRILDDFAAVSGIHPDEAAGNVEALANRLQGEASPLFDAVRSNPAPVWNADLAKLAQRPVISKAIDAAGKSMLNAGEDPLAVGLKLDPDTGGFVLNSDLSQSTEAVPTAATWDKVRRMVGAMVQRDPVTGRVIKTGDVGITNGDLDAARRDLTMALAGDPAHGVPGAIPGYRAALDKAGDYLSMQSAFERAQKMFLSPSVRTKDFATAFNDLTEPEQKAWASGMAAKLSDQLQAGRLTPRQLMLPHVQGKLAAVLGPDAAQAFLARMAQEAQLGATGARMMPGTGSPTMELLNAAGEQEGGPGYVGLALRALHRPSATLSALYDAGQSRVGSPQVRNELGRLLLQSPEDTAAEFSAFPVPLKTGVLPPKLPYPAFSGVSGGYAAQRK